MLSAKGEVEDKISGLQHGADDYLSKPFSVRELEARVEALYRRNISQGINLIMVGDIQINSDTKIVTKQDKKISLALYKDSKINFLIKDEGIGIAKEDLTKITGV